MKFSRLMAGTIACSLLVTPITVFAKEKEKTEKVELSPTEKTIEGFNKKIKKIEEKMADCKDEKKKEKYEEDIKKLEEKIEKTRAKAAKEKTDK